MKSSSCGCGIAVGVILALAVCAGVWYFFYCRKNPDNAEVHFEQVEQGWENVKHSGDKGLHYVKHTFTGNRSVSVPRSNPENDAPETAPLLPPHPDDKNVKRR